MPFGRCDLGAGDFLRLTIPFSQFSSSPSWWVWLWVSLRPTSPPNKRTLPALPHRHSSLTPCKTVSQTVSAPFDCASVAASLASARPFMALSTCSALAFFLYHLACRPPLGFSFPLLCTSQNARSAVLFSTCFSVSHSPRVSPAAANIVRSRCVGFPL